MYSNAVCILNTISPNGLDSSKASNDFKTYNFFLLFSDMF